MGKSSKVLTKEEIKERREMKRRQYEEDKAWIKSLWLDGMDELCDSGRRNDDQEQGEPVHPVKPTDDGGDKGQ